MNTVDLWQKSFNTQTTLEIKPYNIHKRKDFILYYAKPNTS